MNGDESTKRLELVEQAFRTVADCARQVIKSKVQVDDEAISVALGSIGGRLMLAAQLGPDWEQRQLNHWARHGYEVSEKLIETAKYKGAITVESVMFLFRSAPPPEP